MLRRKMVVLPERIQTDFGRLLRGTPEEYVFARSEDDVVESMRRAIKKEMPVTFRGAGHSCGGQTLPSRGLLLESFPQSDEDGTLRENLAVSNSGLVRIPGRARLYEVEKELNRTGFALPVLPDYLHLSLGGVLSVGGIGVGSPGYGFLADQVESLRLVRRDAVVVNCSADQQADLFADALGGLGQAGYIESAVLRVKPRDLDREILRVQPGSMESLAELVAEIGEWSVPPRSLNAWVTKTDIVLEVGVAREEQGMAIRANHAYRIETVERPDEAFALHARRAVWLEQYPDHLRLWSDYFLSAAGFPVFLNRLERLRRDAPESAPAVVYILLIRRPRNAFPFPALPAGAGPHFSAGMYFMTPRLNPLALAATGAVSRELKELAQKLGGTAYGYGWEPG